MVNGCKVYQKNEGEINPGGVQGIKIYRSINDGEEAKDARRAIIAIRRCEVLYTCHLYDQDENAMEFVRF